MNIYYHIGAVILQYKGHGAHHNSIWGSGGIISESLTLELLEVHADLQGLLLYTQHPLQKRQQGPQSWSGCSEEM